MVKKLSVEVKRDPHFFEVQKFYKMVSSSYLSPVFSKLATKNRSAPNAQQYVQGRIARKFLHKVHVPVAVSLTLALCTSVHFMRENFTRCYRVSPHCSAHFVTLT
jgi:hypothetical protein